MDLAFRPTSKDEGRLSGYDGARIDAEAAFRHYTEELGLLSAGVFGLTATECDSAGLPIEPSPTSANPLHVHLDFGGLTKCEIKSVSKKLREIAVSRGVLHAAPGTVGK